MAEKQKTVQGTDKKAGLGPSSEHSIHFSSVPLLGQMPGYTVFRKRKGKGKRKRRKTKEEKTKLVKTKLVTPNEGTPPRRQDEARKDEARNTQ